MRPGAGAALIPSINAPAWEQGLGCRVALYRDWGWDDGSGNEITDARFAEVIKAEGVMSPEGRTKIVGFTITEEGLGPLALPVYPTLNVPREHVDLPILRNHEKGHGETVTVPQKRKLGATDLEIPDSEDEDDEDYGWAEEDDDELPPPPPQWQGSEDILVRGEGYVEDEDEVDEGEDDGDGENKGILEGVTEIEDSEDELAL